MKIEATKLVSERVYNIKSLTDVDKLQVRKLLLDFFAAACAGYKLNREFNRPVESTIFQQGGVAESTVLFSKLKIPARSAAFLNSLYGHGAELDDGNRKAMGHVGVHIIPAVLSLAEAEKKSQKAVLFAMVAGYEAYIRISAAAQPGMVNRAIHSTGMAGAIACAASCAKLLGLNVEGIESAMSLACTMSSGLLTYSESRQMIKPINPAKAAETGVFAARLAQNGVKGPLNALEGPHGWFRAVTDSIDEDMILNDNSGHLLLHDCYIKLYPSCRHTHCGIEAGINIHNRIDLDDVKEIKVHIYPNAIKLAGQIIFPKTADETKFSIHYTLACALLYGEYDVNYMTSLKTDKVTVNMIKRISLISDETMENKEKGIRGTSLEVILNSGKRIFETVLIPKGDPEKPLAFKDVESKFRICCKGVLEDEVARNVILKCSEFGSEKPFDLNNILYL